MKIAVTFDWPILQSRAMELYNFLSSLGHEVYLLHPCEITKKIHERYNTNVKYAYDDKFIDECDYWFYDLSPDNSKPVELTPYMDQLKAYKGQLFCINYEDGYTFFVKRIDSYIQEKTCLFLGNALYINKEHYSPSVRRKYLLTTAYITNSQAFKESWQWFELNRRRKRVYFSGALTGFPTYLTNYNEDEYKLRYNLCKIIVESGVENIVRFTACDPRLQKLFDEVIPASWKENYIDHRDFSNQLLNSRFSLACKGNSFPTNRFYESQAAACVTLTNPLHGEVDFYGTGEPGKDYVEIKADGSDLIEKVRYYIDHDEEAYTIAKNGRRNWEIHNMLDERGVWPEKTFNHHVDGIKSITGIDIRKV
jgi:hypothetical protein